MSSQTRPDVSFHVSNLASSIKNATEIDFKYALKIVKQLQNNIISLSFYNLGKKQNLRIAVYVDASLANLSNDSSQEGYLIFGFRKPKMQLTQLALKMNKKNCL